MCVPLQENSVFIFFGKKYIIIMPVKTRSMYRNLISSTSKTASRPKTKRCKRGTRKNKRGVCDISACQKELNALRSNLEAIFPKVDKLQQKVNKMGEYE